MYRVDEELKQQILSMKLNGVSVTDIANQFRVPVSIIKSQLLFSFFFTSDSTFLYPFMYHCCAKV